MVSKGQAILYANKQKSDPSKKVTVETYVKGLLKPKEQPAASDTTPPVTKQVKFSEIDTHLEPKAQE